MPIRYQYSHQLNTVFPNTTAGTYSPAHQSDPFATSTLPPTTTSTQRHSSSSAGTPDEVNAWMYAHDPNSPYHHQPPPSSDPYTAQRDSGEWDSYSSGGEEPYPSYPVPHNAFGGQDQHQHHNHHQHHEHHHHQQQHNGMYGMANMLNDLSSPSSYSGGGGPNNPTNNDAPDLYTPSDFSRRVQSQSGAGASYSPYPSPGGQGGSRLTPELSQLAIGGGARYTSPLSPDSQSQSQPPVVGGAPGPSRTRDHRGLTSPSHSSGASVASSPYGRPAHHPSRLSHTGHAHQTSISTVSSNSSHSQPQYSPTGMNATAPSIGGSGKIFGNPNATVVLPPISSNSNSTGSSKSQSHHDHPSHRHHEVKKPKKEMVAGTPTHPDIPRPAVVAAPVPVPHLTKKSRGRQVPSVNSVSAQANHSRSREREESSPISPMNGGVHANAGYFGHAGHGQNQWNTSDGEYDEMGMSRSRSGTAGLGHGQRSLFGQAPIPSPLDVGYSGNGGGSNSSLSSPATSLSSRRTTAAEDSYNAGPPIPPPTFAPAAPAPVMAAPSAAGPPVTEADLKARPFVCTVEGCGKAYIRAEHLKRHVRSIHTNDKPYECQYEGCGREFSRYDNLCQHYKGVHGPTKASGNAPSR
jgi:hypothetical protein